MEFLVFVDPFLSPLQEARFRLPAGGGKGKLRGWDPQD